jgi:hypothetical protein
MEMSYRIPKLRLPARLSIYALCEALGIFLQIAMPNILLGTFVMIVGLVFLARKPTQISQQISVSRPGSP